MPDPGAFFEPGTLNENTQKSPPPGFPRGEAVSPKGLTDEGWRAPKQCITPVGWCQQKVTAKTFPWGKVPRLAGAKEGGGMQ